MLRHYQTHKALHQTPAVRTSFSRLLEITRFLLILPTFSLADCVVYACANNLICWFDSRTFCLARGEKVENKNKRTNNEKLSFFPWGKTSRNICFWKQITVKFVKGLSLDHESFHENCVIASDFAEYFNWYQTKAMLTQSVLRKLTYIYPKRCVNVCFRDFSKTFAFFP